MTYYLRFRRMLSLRPGLSEEEKYSFFGSFNNGFLDDKWVLFQMSLPRCGLKEPTRTQMTNRHAKDIQVLFLFASKHFCTGQN